MNKFRTRDENIFEIEEVEEEEEEDGDYINGG